MVDDVATQHVALVAQAVRVARVGRLEQDLHAGLGAGIQEYDARGVDTALARLGVDVARDLEDLDALLVLEWDRGIGRNREAVLAVAGVIVEGEAANRELLGITDRIYVMNEGRMVAEMPAKAASQEKIMRAIMKSWED